MPRMAAPKLRETEREEKIQHRTRQMKKGKQILRSPKSTSEKFCGAGDGTGHGSQVRFCSLCCRGEKREQRDGEKRGHKMAHDFLSSLGLPSHKGGDHSDRVNEAMRQNTNPKVAF